MDNLFHAKGSFHFFSKWSNLAVAAINDTKQAYCVRIALPYNEAVGYSSSVEYSRDYKLWKNPDNLFIELNEEGIEMARYHMGQMFLVHAGRTPVAIPPTIADMNPYIASRLDDHLDPLPKGMLEKFCEQAPRKLWWEVEREQERAKKEYVIGLRNELRRMLGR